MNINRKPKRYPVVTAAGEAITVKESLKRLNKRVSAESVHTNPISPDARALETIRATDMFIAEYQIRNLKPSTLGAILSATSHPKYSLLDSLSLMGSTPKHGERNLRNIAFAFHLLNDSGIHQDRYVEALNTLRIMTGYKDAGLMVKNMPEQVAALLRLIKHFDPQTSATDMFNPELRRMLLVDPSIAGLLVRFAKENHISTFSGIDTTKFAAKAATASYVLA